jgi:hypothetical protein
MLLSANSPALSVEYDFNKPLNQPTNSTLKLIGARSFGPRICQPTAYSDTNPSQSSKSGTGGDNHAPAKPSKSDADFQGPSGVQRVTATLNVGGSFYNSSPTVPGAGVLRDVQAGTEVDVAFCTKSKNWLASYLANATVGFTYYYQDQTSPSILKVTPGTPLPGISIVGLDPSTSQVFTKKGNINFAQIKYGLGVGKNVKFPIAISWSNRTDLITHSLWGAQFGVSYDFSSLLGSSSTSTSK